MSEKLYEDQTSTTSDSGDVPVKILYITDFANPNIGKLIKKTKSTLDYNNSVVKSNELVILIANCSADDHFDLKKKCFLEYANYLNLLIKSETKITIIFRGEILSSLRPLIDLNAEIYASDTTYFSVGHLPASSNPKIKIF